MLLPIAEIKKVLEPLGLTPVEARSHDGPAQEFQLANGQGRVGFISPLSDHFCNTCNRLRMTADGVFRPCLLQDIEVPFLVALRAGQPVFEKMVEAINVKPSGHELTLNHLPSRRCMIQIGG